MFFRSGRILAQEGGIGATSSSLDFAFPPELADALHRLFHLRRGSLLSPGPLQSVDDRAEKRSLFLRFPLDDCLCMMAPSLWSAGMTERNGEAVFNLEPIPSDTLTLWDNVSQKELNAKMRRREAQETNSLYSVCHTISALLLQIIMTLSLCGAAEEFLVRNAMLSGVNAKIFYWRDPGIDSQCRTFMSFPRETR